MIWVPCSLHYCTYIRSLAPNNDEDQVLYGAKTTQAQQHKLVFYCGSGFSIS